jgi:flagellar hook assembly protein FlgD
VVLTVYDVRGARVRTLLDEARVPGDHGVVWDGRSDAGVRVSSGIYFYRLTTGDFRETKKMVLLK